MTTPAARRTSPAISGNSPATSTSSASSAAGHDADVLRGLLTTAGIQLDAVQADPAYQTIRKTRIIARTQQVVRVDRERRTGFSDAQRARALEQFNALLPQLDAIILEDYDKGLFDQAFADAVVSAARTAGKIVSVDPKPSNPIQWRDVTCITPNRGEAFRCAGRPVRDPVDPPTETPLPSSKFGAILLEKWRCRASSSPSPSRA